MSVPTPCVAAPGGQPAGGRPGQPDQVIIQPAGRSPATWALGSLFEHLAGAGQTGGQLGVAVVSPGRRGGRRWPRPGTAGRLSRPPARLVAGTA